jgi:elongation factor P
VAISINELESGIGLKIDGNIWVVLSYQHVKPGKGSAFARVRIRNVKTHQVLERTFRSSESLDAIELEERKLQLMYKSADGYHFMDQEGFEETVVAEDIIGDGGKFLQENMEVRAMAYEHEILQIILPNFIIAEVTEAQPGLKGDSSKSSSKAVTIDTGATVLVPLFINQGEYVRIDTRSGDYVERVKK